jgi:tubulin polyglutamylase TTLL6/13
VNHTPSFTTDTPLDTFIKHKLIRDTLLLMNINSKTKATLYTKAKQYNVDRLRTGKRQIYQGEVKQREVDIAQQARDAYENSHLGGFTRIHPVEDGDLQRKYNDILDYATKAYHEENTLRVRMEEKEAKKMLKEERVMFRNKIKQIEGKGVKSEIVTKPTTSTKKVDTL